MSAQNHLKSLQLVPIGFLFTTTVILLIACIGLFIAKDYGITLDESFEVKMVAWNLELISGYRDSIPNNLKHYGLFFNVATLIPYFFQKLFTEQSLIAAIYDGLQDSSLILFKHKTSFVFNLISFISVAGIVRVFLGWNFAWIGPVILALTPRFWGHLFNNPKDAPFACLFTLCTLVGSYLVAGYVNTDGKTRIGKNKLTFVSISFGFLAGLFSGIRLGGFVIIGFVFLTYFLVSFASLNRLTWSKILNLSGHYLLVILTWFATTLVWFPYAWSNPINRFIEILAYLSKAVSIGPVLFNGEIINNDMLPWFYLPVWVCITVPILIQGGFILGILWNFIKFSKLSILQRSCFILILFQVFALPTIGIIKGTAVQDGMRHFLFILPAMATMCAISIGYIFNAINNRFKIGKIAFTCALIVIFLKIFTDMISLHPYQSIYFNQFARNENIGSQFETDYWGASVRESVEWINNNAVDNSKVLYNGWSWVSPPLAKDSLKFFNEDDFSNLPNFNRPFYYLAFPRAGLLNIVAPFPECKTVYQVSRKLRPITLYLSKVKYCD